VLFKGSYQLVTSIDPGVDLLGGGVGGSVRLGVKVLVVTFAADALYTHSVVLPGGTAATDRGEEEPDRPVPDVMGRAGAAEPAHVAGGEGGVGKDGRVWAMQGAVIGRRVGPGLGDGACELVWSVWCFIGSSTGRWSWCSRETLPGGVEGSPPAKGRV